MLAQLYPKDVRQNIYTLHPGLVLTTLASQVNANIPGPANSWFHPKRVIVRLTNMVGVPAGDSQITVGAEGPGGVNILPATVLTGLTVARSSHEIVLAGDFPEILSNGNISVTVTFADTGAGGGAVVTAEVKVEGYFD